MSYHPNSILIQPNIFLQISFFISFIMVEKNHLHHPKTSLHNKIQKKKKKFHAFNKKNSFILLRYAHSFLHFTQLLCYNCYDYILFIIIFIHLSFFLSFLCKFVLLFFANLFFRIFVHFSFLIFILPLCVFVSILCEYTFEYFV